MDTRTKLFSRTGALGDDDGEASSYANGYSYGYNGYPLTLPATPQFEAGWHKGHDDRAAQLDAYAKHKT